MFEASLQAYFGRILASHSYKIDVCSRSTFGYRSSGAA